MRLKARNAKGKPILDITSTNKASLLHNLFWGLGFLGYDAAPPERVTMVARGRPSLLSLASDRFRSSPSTD